MKILNRLITVTVIFLTLFSCKENKTPLVTSSDSIFEDSLAIANLFNEALTHPQQADSLIQEAYPFSKKNRDLQETYEYYLSRRYIQTGKIQQADSILDVVLDRYQGTDKVYALGKFYNLKSAVAAYQQQQQSSVYYSQQAIEIFDKYNDYRQLGATQFNLANLFFSRLDYESSHKYIVEAKKNFEIVQDSTYIPLADGILAVALTKINEPEQSLLYAEKALLKSIETKNPLGQIVANYALGEYYSNKKQYNLALRHYLEAQQLGETFKIPNLNLPIKAALLFTYNHLEQYSSAAHVGKDALALAKAMQNVDIQYSLNKNLAEALSHIGQEKDAYLYLKSAEELFRNNTITNNQEALQKLLIEYESEKKSNLILQQKNDLAKQQTFMIALIGLVLVSVMTLLGYRRNVQQQRKLAKIDQALKMAEALTQGEEKERIRLSNELHDGIASNLIALKLQLETTENYTQRTQHIELVKKTHQEVRKIAHNLMPIDFEKQDWQTELASFCKDASNQDTQIQFNRHTSLIPLPQKHALIIYRSVQEFIQNALKHAHATEIDVQVLQDESGGFNLSIEDNGIGFDRSVSEKNQFPLAKWKSRFQQIGASFELDSSPNSGTTIFIKYVNNS